MRNRKNYLLIAFTTLLFFSCSKDELDGIGPAEDIRPTRIEWDYDGTDSEEFSFEYNENNQIESITSGDGTIVSFKYSGNELSSIEQQNLGSTSAQLQTELVYNSGVLSEIISYQLSTPTIYSVSYSSSNNSYTVTADGTDYVFNFNSEDQLEDFTSAIASETIINSSVSRNGIFRNVNIPVALPIVYNFYDAGVQHFFFHKNEITSLNYPNSSITADYVTTLNGFDFPAEIAINYTGGETDQITISY